MNRKELSSFYTLFLPLMIIRNNILECSTKNINSTPEPKSQVSFSDHNLSVVCRRRCCHKLFTFSSSSPEPLDQFQPYLAQASLGEEYSSLFK